MMCVLKFFRNLKSSRKFIYYENKYDIMISNYIKFKQIFIRKNLFESREHRKNQLKQSIYSVTFTV